MEKTHYSDAELEEFRKILLEKQKRALFDLEQLKGNIINENDVADTSPSFKVLEEGANTLQKESNQGLILRTEKYLEQIKSALIRIENKTYGICFVTGKLIPKERLWGTPTATKTIEAKLVKT